MLSTTTTHRNNEQCRLALHNLPDNHHEVPLCVGAQGRMEVIFSVMVMARDRKGSDVTHVFLHGVDWKMEKVYVEEFLYRKHLVDLVFVVACKSLTRSQHWRRLYLWFSKYNVVFDQKQHCVPLFGKFTIGSPFASANVSVVILSSGGMTVFAVYVMPFSH
ncbi:IRX15 protein [Spatholobus suberectus]|nr:IRX15 protein [Spatholobus suberectus]